MSVSVNRGTQGSIILTISGSCEPLNSKELPDLFIPFYGKLHELAHLREGSGFEGYLAKNISNMLLYKLDTIYRAHPYPEVTFTLHINKDLQSIS